MPTSPEQKVRQAIETVTGNCGPAAGRLLAADPGRFPARTVRALANTSPDYQRHVMGRAAAGDRNPLWQVAEHLGEATPDGVPHLLARADGDADAVRDDLARYAHEHLGDPGGVPIVDETGFVKTGAKSCGVARQYTGTAGRIANAQVGCSGPTPARGGTPFSTGRWTCRRSGPTTASGATRPALPETWGSPPSRGGPSG